MSDLTIFVVSIDNKPSFYCKTLSEAQDQSIEYLRNLPKIQGYKYQIEKYNDYKFVLTSQYLFYVISYETTECNLEINEISLKNLPCKLPQKLNRNNIEFCVATKIYI